MVVAVSALLLLRSGLLAAAALPGIPVGGPSLCPTPAGLWQELEPLLKRQDLETRPPSPDGPLIRVDDLGPSFRISLLGRSREYRDEARDCGRRARMAALFAALVVDRDERDERDERSERAERPDEPLGPASDTAPPDVAKTEKPRAAQDSVPEPQSERGTDATPDARPLPSPEQPPPTSPTPSPPLPAVSPSPQPSPATTPVAARLEAAGAMMVGVDHHTPGWGGVLRSCLGSRLLGPVVGVGGFAPADTTVGGVHLRQWRVPVDLGVRATVATGRVAWYGELGVVAALLGERARDLATAKAGTAVEIGGRLALGARWPATSAVAALFALSADVIPDPPSVSALPRGNVGHTSPLWLGASLGLSWGIR